MSLYAVKILEQYLTQIFCFWEGQFLTWKNPNLVCRHRFGSALKMALNTRINFHEQSFLGYFLVPRKQPFLKPILYLIDPDQKVASKHIFYLKMHLWFQRKKLRMVFDNLVFCLQLSNVEYFKRIYMDSPAQNFKCKILWAFTLSPILFDPSNESSFLFSPPAQMLHQLFKILHIAQK